MENSLAYEFCAPGRIVFGWGRRRELGTLVGPLGKRVLLVTGGHTLERETGRQVVEHLEAAGIEVVQIGSVDHEPNVDDVDRLSVRLRELPATTDDVVMGLGGGSAIDLAKAVAAMATNGQGASVREFLEGVGSGRMLDQPPLTVVAVPTTAGTGSEATKNAVISGADPPFKKSLRSEGMIPRLVLIDPELTVTTPPRTTAYCGMDAVCQLVESYLSRRGQPLPRALTRSTVADAVYYLDIAVRDGAHRAAREAMAHAALVSGLALANSGLGMAHGVAAALGIHCGVPHGLACAVMLPCAMRTNRAVCEPLLAQLGRAFAQRQATAGTNPPAWSEARAADWAIETIETLCRQIGIPRRLSELGVSAEAIPRLVASSRGNSMNGNPRSLSDDELTSILEQML